MNVSARILLALISVVLITVLGCDRTSLQRTFSADPKATQWTTTPTAEPTPSPGGIPETTPSPINAKNGPKEPPAQPSVNLFTDSNAVPLSLQSYVQEVGQLDVVTNLGGPPNQPIKRSMFARWLVEMNNRMYRDRPSRQIRLATASKPAFVDVPADNSAFPYIQGLAEAGYLPSPLSGDSKQSRFAPDALLTRETLLTWKVPIDRQKILPTVSLDRVKQLWGFKDVNRITPTALSAIAADHQNGDLSNLRRMLGSTLLLQPQKPVTYAEAAAALWFIGVEGDSLSAKDLLRSEQQTAATETASPSPTETPNNP